MALSGAAAIFVLLDVLLRRVVLPLVLCAGRCGHCVRHYLPNHRWSDCPCKVLCKAFNPLPTNDAHMRHGLTIRQ